MPIELTAQEQRRLLRIALGSCTGFAVCKLMNWPYGVFFTVFPMLLLGMIPRFDRLSAWQFICGVLINLVELFLLQVLLMHSPLLMTIGVFAVFALHFHHMARSSHFLMWASGIVTLSVLLHFSSYSDTSLSDMVTATLLATVLSVVSASVFYWLIPETEPVALPPPLSLSASQLNHRMLMGATLATLSFLVFQCFDLRDSLSAQVATVLVLFPMTFQGTITSALNRARGVLFGCALAVVVQILMYDLIQHLSLVILALFITVMITARLHLIERAGSGMGFGALTTIGILFGQYMQPDGDILFSGLYRVSSVGFALTVVMVCAALLDRFLNRFAVTRNR